MSADDPAIDIFEHQERGDAVRANLRSHFLTMPRGSSFCDRSDFELGYAALAEHTKDGEDLSGPALLEAIKQDPRAWLAIRAMLGLSPGEVGFVVEAEAQASGEILEAPQEVMRAIDSRAKRGLPLVTEERSTRQGERQADQLIRKTVVYIGALLQRAPVNPDTDRVHRLEKVDTSEGQDSLKKAFEDGVPYSELLYERMLGRPYASHRDSVSRIVGDVIEDAIKELLEDYGIEGTMARAREHVPGFAQAPDCRIPTENPKVIIEAKLTEDDGTARDKVARVQTLRGYEDAKPEEERCVIVAVIDGRGFGHRSADLEKLLTATDGHVYALEEIDLLVAEGGPLAPFVTKRPSD